MINKIISTLAVLALTSVAAAGEDGFKISGDLATSLFVESGKGNNSSFPSQGALGQSSSDRDFSVDLMELNIEKSMGNSSFVAGIGYGRMFDLINYTVDTDTSAPKATLNLTNAYFAHKFGDTGVSIKVGKFESFMGHESYNYMDNLNYTRGYSFNYTMPWYMTGLNVNYSHAMFDAGLYVVNTTANKDVDDNQNKLTGVSFAYKGVENLTAKVNYLMGQEGGATSAATLMDTTRLNVILGYAYNAFDLGFQYVNYSKKQAIDSLGTTDTKATSMAFYGGWKNENYGAGLRYEMFDDGDGQTFTVADNKFTAITASGWYDIDQNARLKLDIASHSADKQVFVDADGNADDAMMVYGLGFMYRF